MKEILIEELVTAMFGIAAGMNFEGSVSSDTQSDE